jgi:N-acetylmuramoyl-L-alanine amidase
MSARGVPEYDFNLRLAGQVDAALKGAGFSGTQVLVTSGSARRGLAARVARANARPADLFLSLHHDSVPEQFLETWEHDGKPQRYSDRFGGHSLFVSLENRQAEASLRFARALGTALRTAGLHTRRTTRIRSWAGANATFSTRKLASTDSTNSSCCAGPRCLRCCSRRVRS